MWTVQIFGNRVTQNEFFHAEIAELAEPVGRIFMVMLPKMVGDEGQKAAK